MIAKRLLRKQESTPSRLGYALLEIMIIIVGILLSVVITEWFGNRKDNKRETAYLQDIAKDLKSDLEFLRVDMADRTDQLGACQTLIQAQGLAGDISPALAGNVANAFTQLAKTVHFSPSAATFRALESTGRIELIDNDEIVRKLIDLYTGYYNLIEQNNDDVTRYRDNFLLPFMVKNLNFMMASSRAPVKNPLLNTDPATLSELTNHVVYNQFSLSSTVVSYQRAIDHAQETLLLVEKELE